VAPKSDSQKPNCSIESPIDFTFSTISGFENNVEEDCLTRKLNIEYGRGREATADVVGAVVEDCSTISQSFSESESQRFINPNIVKLKIIAFLNWFCSKKKQSLHRSAAGKKGYSTRVRQVDLFWAKPKICLLC
jgi:hypothetical protein